MGAGHLIAGIRFDLWIQETKKTKIPPPHPTQYHTQNGHPPLGTPELLQRSLAMHGDLTGGRLPQPRTLSMSLFHPASFLGKVAAIQPKTGQDTVKYSDDMLD